MTDWVEQGLTSHQTH